MIIVDAARGSHLDPSVQTEVTKGALAPLTAKWGEDATIPEGAQRAEYDPIEYPLSGPEYGALPEEDTSVVPEQLVDQIAAYLSEPRHFYDVLRHFDAASHKTVVRAWGLLRDGGRLAREANSRT